MGSASGVSTGVSGMGLEVHGVVVRAGGARASGSRGALLLAGASFDAPAGALTALLGPNGAGKSTLLRAVAAAPRPESGEVRLHDVDLHALPRRERARRLSLVEQDATTELPLTARAVVRLGRYPYESRFGAATGGDEDEGIVRRALERTGAAHLADRELPTLSGGERQRVLIARALAQQPEHPEEGALLLDEPTNHLDIRAQLDGLALLADLAAEGGTVVAALHDLTLAAAHAHRVVVLAGGRVVAEGPTEQTLTPELVREVYGVEARWIDNPLTGRPLLATARAVE